MINLSPGCNSSSTKTQEAQDIKAIRNEMPMSLLDLKHLKQVRDQEYKST